MNPRPSAGDAGLELLVETLRIRGAARLRVHGCSMRPWLRGGEVVEVRREVPGRVRRGDVVAYARGGGLFVHRVIGKSQREGRTLLITKGDAFPEADAPVLEEELLGRITHIARGDHSVSTAQFPQRLLGLLLARVSASAGWWYPGARATRRFLRRVAG
jgi:signal peptidase I